MENEDILKLDTEYFADVIVFAVGISLVRGRKTSCRARIDILAKFKVRRIFSRRDHWSIVVYFEDFSSIIIFDFF